MRTLRMELATLLVCGAVAFSNCNAVEAANSGESSIAGLNVDPIQIEEMIFDDHKNKRIPPPITTPRPVPPPITTQPVPPPVVTPPPKPYQPHPQGPRPNTPPLANGTPEVYGPPPPSGW